MNVRPPIEVSTPEAVLSVSFNNDASCFAAGLDSGICSKPPAAGTQKRVSLTGIS